MSARDVGAIDAVLLSHDQHSDNLDHSGRDFLKQAKRVLTTEAGAKRLGLVTIDQIVQTLADAIEHPPARSRVVEVPEIRQSRVA